MKMNRFSLQFTGDRTLQQHIINHIMSGSLSVQVLVISRSCDGVKYTINVLCIVMRSQLTGTISTTSA